MLSSKLYVCKYIKISYYNYLAGFPGQGVLNKDPTAWLDRARPANTPILSSFHGMHPCSHMPYSPKIFACKDIIMDVCEYEKKNLT